MLVTMHLFLRVEPEVREKLRDLAARHGKTFCELTVDALRTKLENDPSLARSLDAAAAENRRADALASEGNPSDY